MYKIAKFLFLSCIVLAFLFLLPTHINAAFTKSPFNPQLSVGTSGTWDALHVTDPNVIVDSGTYKMWYSGTSVLLNAGIGFATSTDGLSWSKLESNPILLKDATDISELEVGIPKVIKVDSQYMMWYLSTAQHTGPGSEVYRIKLATSPNGIDNWTRHGYVFRRSGVSWEAEGVVPNSILLINGVYYMWYSARNSSGVWSIGYATSSNGINWSRNINPVLQATLPWEGTTVAAASVVNDGTFFHMYYHAGPVIPQGIGHATSIDGVNWTKDAANPILTRGGFGDFDRTLILAPNALRIGNKVRLYYAGDNGSVRQIGLAEEPQPVTVPYYSQIDPLWGSDTYDHSEIWAAPGKTMAALGCGVTSAAMLLRYYGITKTPGNPTAGLAAKNLDPGSLNEWLKSKNDGAFRNGNTNFALIASMTKQVNAQNPSSQKLEYVRNDSSLDDVLLENPALLKLKSPDSPSGSHFVIAKQKEANTYAINDPRFANRTTLSPHYSTIERVDHFKPTNSDFSYFIFAVEPHVTLSLKDQSGNNVGEQFIEEPLADLETNSPYGGAPLKMLYFRQPENGNYTLEITASESGQYTLDSYVYNQDGVGGVQNTVGALNALDKDILELNFDSEVSDSATFEPQVTFDSLRSDLYTINELGWITPPKLYLGLLGKINTAEARIGQTKRPGPTVVLNDLLAYLQTLVSEQNSRITKEAYNILLSGIEALILTL